MAKRVPARDKLPRQAANTVIMAEHRAFMRRFDRLFAGGLALVDKVNRYFGGGGKQEAERFPPALAPFYEQERKKLGTLVLQIAAWLWLERALRDGDMSAEHVAAEKKKLILTAKASPAAAEGPETQPGAAAYRRYFAQLPPGYRLLAQEVEHFVHRLRHMDKEAASAAAGCRHSPNPVTVQWQKLHRAFGRKK